MRKTVLLLIIMLIFNVLQAQSHDTALEVMTEPVSLRTHVEVEKRAKERLEKFFEISKRLYFASAPDSELHSYIGLSVIHARLYYVYIQELAVRLEAAQRENVELRKKLKQYETEINH